MQNLQETPQTPNLPPPKYSSAEETEEKSLLGLVENLPQSCVLTLYEKTWEDYEKLLEDVGEASWLRIWFNKGVLQIITLSVEHENYSVIVQDLVKRLSLNQKIKVLAYRSATIKIDKKSKGTEPDNCFYVQNADKLPNKIVINFGVDPMPDVVVEIDIHHQSKYKFPIYADFGVAEIWRYDGKKFEIYELQTDKVYLEIERSKALLLLTNEILASFLGQSREKTNTKFCWRLTNGWKN